MAGRKIKNQKLAGAFHYRENTSELVSTVHNELKPQQCPTSDGHGFLQGGTRVLKTKLNNIIAL